MAKTKSPSTVRTGSPVLKLASVIQALLVREHLSFRRAASTLGVRQSAVSRRVRELEDELGVSLFERHNAGVRMTNAGARFLQEAQEALLQLDRAVKAATAAGSGAVGRLNIGILSSMAAGYLRDLIHVYCLRHPDVNVHFQEGDSAESIAAVLKRQVDVVFITDTSQAEGCEISPLWSERIFVVLPQNHLLCGKNEIHWLDLRNEHIIVRQVVRGPILCERFTELLTYHNQRFAVEKLNIGRETLMNLVAMGLGVALTSESTIAVPFPNVVFRPIAGDQRVQFSAAWLSHNDNPALRRLLSLARSMARERRPRADTRSEEISPDDQ